MAMPDQNVVAEPLGDIENKHKDRPEDAALVTADKTFVGPDGGPLISGL